jgi:hypothetical protein
MRRDGDPVQPLLSLSVDESHVYGGKGELWDREKLIQTGFVSDQNRKVLSRRSETSASAPLGRISSGREIIR